MKQSRATTAILVLVGLVGATRPAHAQAQFKVGSFTKSITTTGCPASCTNSFAHGFTGSITPSALILWTDGSTLSGGGGSNGFWWAFGVTDGTTSRSVSMSSEYNVNPTATSRRAAAKPLTIVQWDAATVLAEAAVTWDTANVNIQWSPNNATGYIIHYLVIGAVSAQVVDWTATASGSLTNQSVSSLTFQPSVVLHFMDYDASALPANQTTAAFTLGVMDAGGHQWTMAVADNTGLSTTGTGRAQRTDATLEEISCFSNCSPTETLRAHWVSMDSNGWTVNFDVNSVGAHHIYSLALSGLNVWAGTFTRNNPTTTTPYSEPVTGTGFTPGAVFLGTWNDAENLSTGPFMEANAFLTVGAASSTATANMASSGPNEGNNRVFGGSTKSTPNEFDFSNKIIRVNNQAGTFSQAEATLASFDSNGFTLSWTFLSDTVASQILYLALGPLGATSVTLASFTATRLPDGKTRLDWRTGYEVDNVGFRLYREQNGKRVRITSSIVPGSALMGAGRGMSVGGRTYNWSDAAVPLPDAGPVQYWLEDVDLKGKSTWHGPIVPVMTPPREPR